jgi:hypothetical protein
MLNAYAVVVRAPLHGCDYADPETDWADWPTLYLLENVQGITGEDHARRIVKRTLDRAGIPVANVSVARVTLDPDAYLTSEEN